ncbi:unnamed protein product [Prunus armeniaca]|uniref:Uncharacterized protein n=1 Tax=Prunus armeniaca TaxID=36596 RepID=A0A6J5VU42_PRUAR|nr:unnamed protein product [Prunus armeniaca]CAB4321424.1 unnamed protein product [Prunus armeniaca]
MVPKWYSFILEPTKALRYGLMVWFDIKHCKRQPRTIPYCLQVSLSGSDQYRTGPGASLVDPIGQKKMHCGMHTQSLYDRELLMHALADPLKVQ